MSEIKYGGEGYKYKDICALFGDNKATGGKDRATQLEKWQKKYEIDKVGTRYIIQRELSPEEIQLIGNHGKFTTYIQAMLVWLLGQQESHEVRMGYKDIFEFMHIVNQRYYSVKYGAERLEYMYEAASETESNPDEINDYLEAFYESSNRSLKRMVRESLESMSKRNLIIYSKSYRLFKRVYVQETKSWKVEKHECTDEEVSAILRMYIETMKKFNVKEERFIHILPPILIKAFYAEIDEMIQERFGYDYHRETFKILLAEGFEHDFQPIRTETTQRLNENVQDKLSNQTDLVDTMKTTGLLELFIRDLISM